MRRTRVGIGLNLSVRRSGGGLSIPTDGLRMYLSATPQTVQRSGDQSNSNKITGWTDGTLTATPLDNTELVLKKVGSKYVVQFDKFFWSTKSANKLLRVTDTPFDDVTSGTVIMLINPKDKAQYIPYGNGTTTAVFDLAVHQGSVGAPSSAGRTPTFRLNGEPIAFTNRGDAYTKLPKSDYFVLTIQNANLSAFSNFSMGMYAGTTNGFDFVGDVGDVAVYDETLTNDDLVKAENILLSRAEHLNAFQNDYDYELTDTVTVVPDEINEATSANTGLAYDTGTDEIVTVRFPIGEWGVFDPVTLTQKRVVAFAENLLPQGFAIDGDNGIYYQVVTPSPNPEGINLISYDRLGIELDRFQVTGTGIMSARLDFNNGHLFALDTSNYTIKKIAIGNGELTVVSSKPVFPRRFISSMEGLIVREGLLYGFSEIDRIRLYDWNTDALLTEFVAIPLESVQDEGLTMSPSGVIYRNDDNYFHGPVPDGNEMRVYKVL